MGTLFKISIRTIRSISQLANKRCKGSAIFSSMETRQFSASTNTLAKLALLHQRGVFETSGRDSEKLLQGLITNDMSLLSNNDCTVLHSFVLNVQGRIMFDMFIYKSVEENRFLIECDKKYCADFIAHLKKYKLRSKVKFHEKADLNVFSLFDDRKTNESLDCQSKQNYFVKDPRLDALGYRFITDSDVLAAMKNIECTKPIENVDDNTYNQHRFNLGISEGVVEIINGIPLEHNVELLNSVSFQKGCYVGQELVARAYFTGVIRKRVMAVRLVENLNKENIEETVYNAKGKRAGKILAMKDGCGLGLMRLKDSLVNDPTELFVKSAQDNETRFKAIPTRSKWWPNDLKY